MRHFLILVVLFSSLGLRSQSLELVTISSTSVEVENNEYTLSSTFGEAITSTFSGASHVLTQGFEQPNTQTENSINTLVKQGNILMYPNPVSSTVTIVGKEPHTVKVYGVHGKLLFNKPYHFKSPLQIDVTNWPAGIYQVFFFKDGWPLSTSKFIKQ